MLDWFSRLTALLFLLGAVAWWAQVGTWEPRLAAFSSFAGYIYLEIRLDRKSRATVRRKLSARADLSLADNLQQILQQAYDDRRYLDVVRLGAQISRFLWLSGFRKQRIVIGKLVESSAAQLGDTKVQIQCLVDDLGWTYVDLGEYEKARLNIANGVRKALDTHEFFWAAKGERHLAGLASRTGRVADIRLHLEEAQKHAKLIKDKVEKANMLSSLHLAFAEWFFEQKDFAKANSELQVARNGFSQDPDRLVKTHALAGNIHFALGDLQRSKDEFAQGYRVASDRRDDEFGKNAVGLARVAIESDDFREARRYLREAADVFERLGSTELAEVTRLKQRLPDVGN